VFVPEKRGEDRSALLYINERGKEAEVLEFELLEELAQKGNLVVAVDVRGIGETKPAHPDDAGCGLFGHVDDAETTMQYIAWEMNESLLGMRVQDVVRSVDYAVSRADVDRAGVRVIGRGMGALWVLLAAALDPRISRTVCDGGLLSYTWFDGSTQLPQTGAVVDYVAPGSGSHTFTLTVTDNGGLTSTTTQTVTVQS